MVIIDRWLQTHTQVIVDSCIGKIIAGDLSLMLSRLYRLAVTRPRVRCSVSNGSGFGPEQWFGSVPDPSSNPTNFVLAGLLPGPDIFQLVFTRVVLTLEPHFSELRIVASIKYSSCDHITI